MKTELSTNAIQRIARVLVLGALLTGLLGSPQPARATSTITVDTTDGGLVDDSGDGPCSLAEAVTNANNDAVTYDDCIAGSGADTIDFASSLGTATITLSADLPAVTDADGLTIDGGGDITVSGGGSRQILDFSSNLNTLEHITIAHAYSNFSYGAVHVASGASLTIRGAEFDDNHSDSSRGGGVRNDGGTLNIVDSSFLSNVAAGGAAVDIEGGSTTITNSTFHANAALGVSGLGGAMFANGGTTTITNSTFSLNSAGGNGGNLYLNSGTLNLYNSIFAAAITGGACANGGGTFFGSNNLVNDLTWNCGLTDGVAGNIVGSNPSLASITGAPAYLPLNPDSPAIDAGDNAVVPGGITTDEPGNPRFVDMPAITDTGSGTVPIVDMGAVEAQYTCPGGTHLYVDADASGANDGSSWTDAFAHLQYAIASFNACSGPDQTWVAEGVYVPGPTYADRFNIASGMQVYGGFAGTESNLSQRDWTSHPTILSGDIFGDDDSNNADGNSIAENASEISGTNTSNIIWMDHVDSSTVLDGFIITGGQAITGFSDGGGLMCDGQGVAGVCKPVLSHLLFSGNTANYGGGVFNYGYNDGDASPTITDVTFVGNHADQEGGAISNYGYLGASSPILTRVTFESNDALHGGALGNFTGNAGTSSPIVKDATFFDNTATGHGGAVYNRALNAAVVVSPEFTNVTFSQNSAAQGGAMYNFGESGGASTPVLVNTILWGDSAGTGPEIRNDASTSSISYSVVQGGCGAIPGAGCGAGNLSSDPNLGALADNGGETETMALTGTSPAIDTGTNTGCPATDQRSLARPQGPKCDIGAYEKAQPTVTYRSVGTQDGWLLESSETSGKAGKADSAATQFYLGDDAANKQYRGILSFDTSPLPDTAVITQATLKIKKTGLVGADPFLSLGNIVVDMKGGPFSGNPGLQLTDFYAAGSKNFVAQIPNLPVAMWYSKLLGSTANGYINLTGPTQFRLRFATDDNNNLTANYMKFGSGNAVTSSRPVLTLTYYVP